MINELKVGIAKLADYIDARLDPYEEFTRPTFGNKAERRIKAEAFEADFVENNKVVDSETAVIWNYKRQLHGGFDLGDQCLWHGVATFFWAVKFHVTKSEEASKWLYKSLNGMFAHQRTFWADGPRLVRGSTDILGQTYQDDVSNDQLTGHLLGIYAGIKYGRMEHRQIAYTLASNIARYLLHKTYNLCNLNGEPTKHGRLINGILTEPMGLGLSLLALKLGAYSSASESIAFSMEYYALSRKYAPIIPYAHMSLGSWRKDYDAHRAAIIYSLLADLERGDHDLSRLYVKGLMRSWKRERKSRNPWIYYLMRRVMLMDPSDLEGCWARLDEMTVADKINVEARINSLQKDKWEALGVKFVKVGDKLRSTQPLPLCNVASQDFFWQRSQYSVDDRVGQSVGEIAHNGLDYLVAYWGLKELGLDK